MAGDWQLKCYSGGGGGGGGGAWAWMILLDDLAGGRLMMKGSYGPMFNRAPHTPHL